MSRELRRCRGRDFGAFTGTEKRLGTGTPRSVLSNASEFTMLYYIVIPSTRTDRE